MAPRVGRRRSKGASRALELQRKALAIRVALVSDFPENHAYRGSVAENRVFLARILAMKGQFGEAQDEIDNALATLLRHNGVDLGKSDYLGRN